MEFINNIEFWHWWVAAAVFIVIEMLDGSGHFIWLGISAAIVGCCMSWQVEMFLFAAISIGSIFAWKAYKRKNPDVDAYPTLNRRGTNHIGRIFTLTDPIVDGVGKVNVDDTIWIVRGPDLDAGSKIKVAGLDGTSFVVEAVHTRNFVWNIRSNIYCCCDLSCIFSNLFILWRREIKTV